MNKECLRKLDKILKDKADSIEKMKKNMEEKCERMRQKELKEGIR